MTDHSRRRSVLQAFATLFRSSMVRSIGSLLGFAATFLVTASLGAADAGVLYGSITWVAGLAILARWGVIDRILVELPPMAAGWRHRAVAAIVNRDLRNSLIRIIVLLGIVACLWGVAIFAQKPLALSLPLLIGLFPATVILQILSASAKAWGRVATALFFEFALIPAVVIIVVLLIAISPMPGSTQIVGIAYLGGTVLAIWGCYSLLLSDRWHARPAAFRSRRTRIRDRNFGLIEFSNFLNSWLAMLLLPLLMAADDVGIFNLSLRLAGAIGLISATIYVIVMPGLAVSRAQRNTEEWRTTLRNAHILMAALGAGFAIVIFKFGPLILGLAGEEFLEATVPLYILTGCYSLAVALGPGGGVLSAIGEEAVVRNANIATTVLSLLAMVPAILQFGLVGAAIVSGATFLALKGALLFYQLRMTRALEWERAPPGNAAVAQER